MSSTSCAVAVTTQNARSSAKNVSRRQRVKRELWYCMRKSVCKVCPRGTDFSNAPNSDVFAGKTVALRGVITLAWRKVYNAGLLNERTSQHADPHELPAKFLLRVRREDRAAALVCLDQPQVLRQMFTRTCAGALAAAVAHDRCLDSLRRTRRARLPSRATALDH